MPKRSTINECDSCSSVNSTEIKISVHSSSLRWLVRPPSAVHMQSECLPNTQAARKECIPLNWLKIIYALGAIFFLGNTKESLRCMATISLREQYTDSCWCALLKNGEKKLSNQCAPLHDNDSSLKLRMKQQTMAMKSNKKSELVPLSLTWLDQNCFTGEIKLSRVSNPNQGALALKISMTK